MILIAVLTVLCLIVIVALTLPSVQEKYTDIASNLLTTEANREVSDKVQNENNQFCEITTNTNNKFQFKVENVMLDWFKVPNKPNTCSVELGSDDIDNRVDNCSKTNTILYDPTLVKDIYYDDNLQGIKRCVVQFKDNPSQTEMQTYLKKQKSYQNITDCSDAVRQVAKLGEENRKLKAQERDAINREARALRQAAEAEEKERQALAKASQLEAKAQQLQRQADAEEAEQVEKEQRDGADEEEEAGMSDATQLLED